ncbi:hypothetical protein [Rhodoplanes roseus]|uniref:hypothetical protein n=1 Tax=Rhodoplanes roseus TaxID=29409 RepID=UPI003CCAE1BE
MLGSSCAADEIEGYKRIAGVAVIGVLCGGSTEQALREAGCVTVYRDRPICSTATRSRRSPQEVESLIPRLTLRRSADSSSDVQSRHGHGREHENRRDHDPRGAELLGLGRDIAGPQVLTPGALYTAR